VLLLATKPVAHWCRWVDLVQDFMAEFIAQPCVLVGNSVGSLVVLTVRC
jgi:alpha-beta hydrolase superfamily lysophospholipase